MQQPQWTMILRPRKAWYEINLRELWDYRDLIVLFVWRDFVSYYKQTVLGPVWFLIQPVLTTLTYVVIFGNIAHLSTNNVPQFLFYLAGTVLWGYFSSCLTKTATTFIGNAPIFGKVYFPRLTAPISVLISNLITFGIQFALFVVGVIYYSQVNAYVRPNWFILLTPLLLLIMAGQGLGLGIIISSLTTAYRDLQMIVIFGVQLLMYATPVIYPLSSVPEQYRWLLALNPITPLMETFRYAFLGQGELSLGMMIYSIIFTIVVVMAGVLMFNQVENNFMDRV